MNRIRIKMFSLFLGINAIFSPLIVSEDLGLSPEEIEQYVAEMEQEYNQMLASFTPEERAQWEKEQEEIERIIGNMDEKELNALVEEMMKQPWPEIEAPLPEQKNVTPSPVEFVEPKKEPSPLDLSKYESLIELLEDIIKRTDSLLVKVASIPDMKLRIDRWIRVKGIASWPEEKTWDLFVTDIEQCMQQLSRLKEKDNKTGLFKYLDALKNQKTIIETLEKLKKALHDYEPRIIITSFGLEPISSNSRKSLKSLITEFSSILYTQKTSEEINKIFAEFEPEAQKRRMAVDSARAEAAKSVESTQSGFVVGGQPNTGYNTGTTYSTGFTGGQTYYPNSYPSGQTTYPYSSGQSYNPTSSQPSGQLNNPPAGTNPVGTNPIAGQPDQTKTEISNMPTDAAKKDADADRLFGITETGFIELQSLIQSNSAFNEIKNNLTDPTRIISETDDFVIRLVPLVEKQINTVVSDINAFARRVRVLPGDTQSYYTELFKTMADKNSNLIKKLEIDLNEIQSYWTTIPQEKQKTYFKTTTLPVEPIKSTESTLLTLKEAVNKLMKILPSFPKE